MSNRGAETLAAQLAKFPAVLRELIEAELAAGNEIVEIASCFPAPPVGAYVKFARPISTRPRAKSAALDFYDRNSSSYSGEWTDAKRFFFVLEPPHPPPPEPDMDAIREASNRDVSQLARLREPDRSAPVSTQTPTAPPAAPMSLVRQFEASMVIDYEKWHDGIGYDLSLLKHATAAELTAIEALLLSRGVRDWRDVEALAAFDGERAQAALRTAFASGNAEIRGAVMRHAPALVPTSKKLEHLLAALRTADFYGGLTQALDAVAEYHPPGIVAELLRGALERKGDVAVHFAAMLMFIHGKAPEAFDWNQRPFFLRFNTAVRSEREAVFRELCVKIGVDPKTVLPSTR
jgi:hypothetical protein